MLKINLEHITQDLKEKIETSDTDVKQANIGRILFCGDGIVKISGLSAVKYNELLEIEGGVHAIALNLERGEVGAIVLEDEDRVRTGLAVRSTGKIVQVPVGEELLGRVVNPLGKPIDGMGDIKASETRPVEYPAPSIMDRGKVDEPLQTGILAIDAMIPIGRGQRELIIGDRQCGKTAIAIDTILNQRGKDVICVYVAIGQKASTLAAIQHMLISKNAMSHTIMVCSTAKDSAPLQYIAPFAGSAIAEYFMYKGKDVLIVYDDLSKHAVAYRQISLLLKRPPGREAYPGDVFYLHSRLLERAAKLSPELGGGSITALPIVETLAGDISAYIPTNIISITDGQIYLENELFNSGVRPAVNVGLSVSRVGGAAQTPVMRKLSGKLRIDLAQYRELAIFSQFASDLDKATTAVLSHGQKLTELLKQKQYVNLSVAEMSVLLYVVSNNLLKDVDAHRVNEFKEKFLEFMHASYPKVFAAIENSKKIGAEEEKLIAKAANSYASYFAGESVHAPEHEAEASAPEARDGEKA